MESTSGSPQGLTLLINSDFVIEEAGGTTRLFLRPFRELRDAVPVPPPLFLLLAVVVCFSECFSIAAQTTSTRGPPSMLGESDKHKHQEGP